MPNKVICSTIGIRHPVPVCGSRKCQVWQPSSGGRVFVIAIIVVAPYRLLRELLQGARVRGCVCECVCVADCSVMRESGIKEEYSVGSLALVSYGA
mgnify:CR=1 FL=1